MPGLVGAAVAYAVSGDASASGDQRLHEEIKVQDLRNLPVGEIMQQQVISVPASLTLSEFAAMLTPHVHHEIFPVFEGQKLLGTCSLWAMSQVSPKKWSTSKVAEIVNHRVHRISPDTDVMEALRLLVGEHNQPILLVVQEEGRTVGIVTKTDILKALKLRRDSFPARDENFQLSLTD